MWRLYLLRAPVTVVLVSRPDPAAKVPVFNQILSAGAAGMALVSAATALGYGAQWLLNGPAGTPRPRPCWASVRASRWPASSISAARPSGPTIVPAPRSPTW